MAQPSAEKQILTYWLIPAEPARAYFTLLIGDLAARFDALVFEPHLTVYVMSMGNANAAELFERVVAGCQPYSLLVDGVDYSDEFTKTVFVQFKPNEAVTRLSAKFREASTIKNEYQINPHVSLIYKALLLEEKEQIVTSLRLPFQDVLFDSVKAVIGPAKIESREDVAAWRVVAIRKLPA